MTEIGTARRCPHYRDTSRVQNCAELLRESRVAIDDKVFLAQQESGEPVRRVPGDLLHPAPFGFGGDAQDLDAAGYQRGRSLSKGLESQRQELRWVMLAHNLRILSRKLIAERKAREDDRKRAA